MARKSKAAGKAQVVSIVGIGRVGLPLALFLAEGGCKVYGLDVDSRKVNVISKGAMPFREDGAEELLKKHIGKSFIPTTDFSNISKSKIIILTLGTPVDDNMNPSLVQIDRALESIKPFFRPGQLLVLRSTVSPGTTNYVRSSINEVGKVKVGVNFYLAFCPERIAEGKSLKELSQIPQIVGGVDRASTIKAAQFFQSLGIEVNKSDDVSAELSKLFTNMYRYINFAIANEFMILAGNYNRDIYKITDLVNKNYKRGGLSLPGLTGGPCLFKDGFFLISDVPFADLISTSWKINESIPLYLINKIRQRRKLEGKKAVILGLAFKADIDDTRESLAFKVNKALERERAKVFLHDPYIAEYQTNLKETLKDADFVFIATNHSYYKKLDIAEIKKLVSKNCVICDVWNVFKTNRIIFTINSLDTQKNGNTPTLEEFENNQGIFESLL
ncbi:MAG: nucleotide sugar dehydrogenase [Patescibacteria group bacterium]